MDTRKITIVSTKTQKKSVIMSGAETLGELKRDLDAANIDYEDMTFYEGTSKTELKTDESVLPKDVPYTNRTTGETINTNELVFMLTNTNKKIKSGVIAGERAKVYAAIKDNNLQDLCVKTFKKSYTQCSTQDLINFVKAYTDSTAPQTSKQNTKTCECACKVNNNPVQDNSWVSCIDAQAREAITVLVNILYNEDYLVDADRKTIFKALSNASSNNPEEESPYSDNEIDKMFEGMY